MSKIFFIQNIFIDSEKENIFNKKLKLICAFTCVFFSFEIANGEIRKLPSPKIINIMRIE